MKKKLYLTLDTETATLPFANDICKDAKQKQKIAIAKPLVYDIGWVVSDRKGNVIKTENFLIQETFFVPNVFNTAYYKDKRPIYIELLKTKKIQTKTWNEAIEILLEDLEKCDLTVAYNACFDFKKAIPFTEKFINHLYNEDFPIWEEKQKEKCFKILKGTDESNNSEYLMPYFELRGKRYPLADLWEISCKKLINNQRYKNYCLKNKLLTNSATYFKTSAETTFQYLAKNESFEEDHTALSDALIEKDILTKALNKGKVEAEIGAFPFRALGTTIDYVLENKNKKYRETVVDALRNYIEQNDGETQADFGNKYWKRMIKIHNDLIDKL